MKDEQMLEETDYLPSDADLLHRALRGDEDAFTVFFNRYYEGVRAFAIHMLGDVGSGEDVAQEAFVRVARSAGTFRGDASAKGWVFRIAGNLARDHLRARAARAQAAAGFAAHLEIEASGSHATPHFAEKAWAALAALPDAQRAAVALVLLHGFTHAEAARSLGCAEATVSWRIMLAKRQLRRNLR